jgi:hypothetical protein
MRASNAAINAADASRVVDWSAAWDTPAATKLFAFVRQEVCGLPPVTAGLTADVVTEALAEVQEAILAEAGEDGPRGGHDHDGYCDTDDQGEADADAWAGESWKRTSEEYRNERGDRPTVVEIDQVELRRLRPLLNTEVSLPHVYAEIRARRTIGRAADSIVEALMLSLRGRGVQALDEPDTRRRLGQLNDEQIVEVGDRFQRLKPEIARAWSAEEIGALMELREMLR